jgi:hypothetical protein
MATTILTKRSNTASAVPLAADLTNSSSGAELAVNTADKRLFTKDSGGTVVELGINPSSLTLSGGTANGIPYLNGSKVVTSGSVLQFDGTNLLVGATSSSWSATNRRTIEISGTSSSLLGMNVGGLTSGYLLHDGSTLSLFNNTSGSLAFGAYGSEGMRLTSTGLGIGTTSPTFAAGGGVQVKGSGFTSVRVTSGALTGTDFSQDSSGGYLYVRDNLPLMFGTNNTERARIDSSGRFLVGATSTYSNATKATFQGVQTGGGDAVVAIYNSESSSGDSSPPLALYKAMTTTSSSARFVQFYANGAGTPMGGIVGNGSSNVQFATLSDIREKTNIQPISGSLEKINALRPVKFDWIADGSHVNAGFVAQEVETVFPEFVVENMANEGQEARKGLTGGMTGGIVAHLVKAIQELKAEFDAYKASHP